MTTTKDTGQKRVCRFVGGPLDGQTMTLPTRWRACSYRGEDGLPVSTSVGDRVACSGFPKPRRGSRLGIYNYRKRLSATGRLEDTYEWIVRGQTT